MKPDGRNIPVVVRRIVDEEGQEMQSAPHPKQVLYIELAAAENGALSGADVSEQDNHAAELYDILRRKRRRNSHGKKDRYVAYVGTYTHGSSVGNSYF